MYTDWFYIVAIKASLFSKRAGKVPHRTKYLQEKAILFAVLRKVSERLGVLPIPSHIFIPFFPLKI